MAEGAAESDRRDRDMLWAVYAVLFFGVPSRGMENRSRMAMVQGQPNASFISMLDRNSEALASQHRRFCEVFSFHDSVVFSFFETAQSPTAIQVRVSVGGRLLLAEIFTGQWTVGNGWAFRGPCRHHLSNTESRSLGIEAVFPSAYKQEPFRTCKIFTGGRILQVSEGEAGRHRGESGRDYPKQIPESIVVK
jgi:hypothetical protein